jgi:hypothetical protein
MREAGPADNRAGGDMTARIPVMVLMVLIPVAAPAQRSDHSVRIEGRACRINRSADRFIVMTNSGLRLRVAAAHETRFTFGREPIEASDLRPGDLVGVAGRRTEDDIIEADGLRLRPDLAEAAWDAIFPRRPESLVGRFGVREAQTEFFSLNLPGMNYVRVDAKSAYGKGGRVRVGNLKIGDLLEVRGEWVSDGLYKASFIDVLTDSEPPSCRGKLSAEEVAAERTFLGR